jgi:hypothetical protein
LRPHSASDRSATLYGNEATVDIPSSPIQVRRGIQVRRFISAAS